jgi:hypothetical protein
MSDSFRGGLFESAILSSVSTLSVKNSDMNCSQIPSALYLGPHQI